MLNPLETSTRRTRIIEDIGSGDNVRSRIVCDVLECEVWWTRNRNISGSDYVVRWCWANNNQSRCFGDRWFMIVDSIRSDAVHKRRNRWMISRGLFLDFSRHDRTRKRSEEFLDRSRPIIFLLFYWAFNQTLSRVTFDEANEPAKAKRRKSKIIYEQ